MEALRAVESGHGALVGEVQSHSFAVVEMLQRRWEPGVVAELGSSAGDPRIGVDCCSCSLAAGLRERSVEALAVVGIAAAAAAAEGSRVLGGFGRRLEEQCCSLGCSKGSLGEADAVEEGSAMAVAAAVAAKGFALPFRTGISYLRLEKAPTAARPTCSGSACLVVCFISTLFFCRNNSPCSDLRWQRIRVVSAVVGHLILFPRPNG